MRGLRVWRWLFGICQSCGEPQPYYWFGRNCRICARLIEQRARWNGIKGSEERE